jgi:hypothetical protein
MRKRVFSSAFAAFSHLLCGAAMPSAASASNFSINTDVPGESA